MSEDTQTLVVELNEPGGAPVSWEVVPLDDGQRVAVTLTGIGEDDDPSQALRLVAAPEDLCFEIDRATGRPSRAPVVNPALEQEFSAPFDVVVVAHLLDEIPRMDISANVAAMARQHRAIRHMESGGKAFDVEATVTVPAREGATAYRAGVRCVPGPEVTLTAIEMLGALLADVRKKRGAR